MPIIGGPKIRAAVRRKAALGSSAGQWCYRICYFCFLFGACYVVASRIRGARLPPLGTMSTRSVVAGGESAADSKNGVGGAKDGLSMEGVASGQGSARDHKHEHLRRWIAHPNSLCFGRGNITILSVAIGLPQSYLELLRSNRLAYGGIHGYRYCEVRTSLDVSRPPAWTKVKATALLLSFAETVMHIEADALITNHSISIESIINNPEYNVSGKDAIYTNDFKQSRDFDVQDGRMFISSANYIMRSTPWSKALLEAQDKFYRESALFNKYEEQDALNLYRMKHFEDYIQHVGVVPFRYMNSPCSEKYNLYEPGDFIAHFVGGTSPEKYERLAAALFLKDPNDSSCSTCDCFLKSGRLQTQSTTSSLFLD
ncbi:hypothetical protein R1sor_014287 [Riccia sorocarpa]|uniref:Nucleotide-diphospho-sugar transferase domain-containing protein n=1 Tax=Riccia sorocarpa TaxID=122646 RepID=A0ABD3H8Z7_9MARC